MLPVMHRLDPNQKAKRKLRNRMARSLSACRVAKQIEDLALRLLERHPHFRGRTQHIEVRCSGKHLVLDGCLPSFYLKQLAQEAMLQLLQEYSGVSVENRIVVASPSGEVSAGDARPNCSWPLSNRGSLASSSSSRK